MTSILDQNANDRSIYHGCGGTILSGADHVYCDRCGAVVYYGGDLDCETPEEASNELMLTKAGYAAHRFDGTEYHDLGAGWETAEEAKTALVEQGADLDDVEIYRAVTRDGWQNWEPAE